MPLERANHAVEYADQGSSISLGFRLVGDRFKLVDSEEVLDRAHVLSTWILLVVELQDVHKVGGESLGKSGVASLGLDGQLVANHPVSEGTHAVLGRPYIGLDLLHHLCMKNRRSITQLESHGRGYDGHLPCLGRLRRKHPIAAPSLVSARSAMSWPHRLGLQDQRRHCSTRRQRSLSRSTRTTRAG